MHPLNLTTTANEPADGEPGSGSLRLSEWQLAKQTSVAPQKGHLEACARAMHAFPCARRRPLATRPRHRSGTPSCDYMPPPDVRKKEKKEDHVSVIIARLSLSLSLSPSVSLCLCLSLSSLVAPNGRTEFQKSGVRLVQIASELAKKKSAPDSPPGATPARSRPPCHPACPGARARSGQPV